MMPSTLHQGRLPSLQAFFISPPIQSSQASTRVSIPPFLQSEAS